MKLVLQPTSTAQWQALVSEAEQACATRLDEELQSYLVFLLMRFTSRPELAARILALDFLHGMTTRGRLQEEQLRDVGDQCLLYSGFYPEQAQRRLVNHAYFIDLGRSAYGTLAERVRHATAEVYAQLAEAFVHLRDILQAMRELDSEAALDPLHNAGLWQETGSRRALDQYRRQTGAIPIPLDEDPERPH